MKMAWFAVPVSLALTCSAASAEMTTLSRSGYWEVIGGTPNNSATPMCGISTKFPALGGLFFVKWNGDGVFIQVFKTGWNISQGMQVDVAIQFDRLAPWTGKASGIPTKNNLGGLELTVPGDRLTKFLEELRFASVMVVSFPSGTESAWPASMTGSNQAAIAMSRCVSAAAGQPYPVQPQPYSVQPPVVVAPQQQPQPFRTPQPAPPSPFPAVAPLRQGFEAI